MRQREQVVLLFKDIPGPDIQRHRCVGYREYFIHQIHHHCLELRRQCLLFQYILLPLGYVPSISLASSARLCNKPTHEELTNVLKQDPDTKSYQNRVATIMADSHAYKQSMGEGFRQMAMMSDAPNTAAKEEALLCMVASSVGMGFGRLNTMIIKCGLKPVDASMRFGARVLHTMPDHFGSLIDSNSTFGSGPFAGAYDFPLDGDGGGVPPPGAPPPPPGAPPPPGGERGPEGPTGAGPSGTIGR